jgi:hypothetical protein
MPFADIEQALQKPTSMNDTLKMMLNGTKRQAVIEHLMLQRDLQTRISLSRRRCNICHAIDINILGCMDRSSGYSGAHHITVRIIPLHVSRDSTVQKLALDFPGSYDSAQNCDVENGSHVLGDRHCFDISCAKKTLEVLFEKILLLVIKQFSPARVLSKTGAKLLFDGDWLSKN